MVPSMSLFRPIAPALDSLPTNALADIDMDVYAASCNPPRRAKRLRSDSNPTFTPPQLEAQTSLSPSSSADQGDQDAYDVPQPPPPKRRGRKPGTLSRAAREAQRKINHSLIEKARRTKINDALATLRELVPPEYKRANEAAAEDSDDDEEEDPKKGKTKPKGTGEKEFKLEILVRTVAYLQDLTERIKELEEKGCPRCKEPIPCSGNDKSLKRKRESHAPKANSTGNGGHGKPCEDVDSAVTSRSSSLAPPTSRLPSISAWLPSSAEEQRSLLLTPSQSPSFDPVLSGASARPIGHQLPTPPTSTTFAPSTAGFSMPPVLTLPSPSAFLSPNGSQMQPRFSGFVPRANNKGSPLASPVYTPEDETAASLLLRISTSTSPQASFKKPAASRSSEVGQSRDDKWKVDTGYALTPSRLLGLTDEER